MKYKRKETLLLISVSCSLWWSLETLLRMTLGLGERQSHSFFYSLAKYLIRVFELNSLMHMQVVSLSQHPDLFIVYSFYLDKWPQLVNVRLRFKSHQNSAYGYKQCMLPCEFFSQHVNAAFSQQLFFFLNTVNPVQGPRGTIYRDMWGR